MVTSLDEGPPLPFSIVEYLDRRINLMLNHPSIYATQSETLEMQILTLLSIRCEQLGGSEIDVTTLYHRYTSGYIGNKSNSYLSIFLGVKELAEAMKLFVCVERQRQDSLPPKPKAS